MVRGMEHSKRSNPRKGEKMTLTIFLSYIAVFAAGFGMCFLTISAGLQHDSIYQAKREGGALQATEQEDVECSGCIGGRFDYVYCSPNSASTRDRLDDAHVLH